MGEGDIGRIFDRLESMERDAAKRHLEIKLEMQDIKKDRDAFQAALAKYQEELSDHEEWRHACEIREAHSKGKIAAYLGAGGFIVFLADRLGLWDILRAMFY